MTQINIGKAKGNALDMAKAAVQKFEDEVQVLQTMRSQFDQDYPEAAEFLSEVKHQEDSVADAIAKAKPLVAKAGETVGDFKCQKKFSKAHYDPEAVTKMMGDAENGGDVFMMFMQAGIIKKIEFDKDATVAYFAQNPELAEFFADAWKDKKAMTPAVSVPKF